MPNSRLFVVGKIALKQLRELELARRQAFMPTLSCSVSRNGSPSTPCARAAQAGAAFEVVIA